MRIGSPTGRSSRSAPAFSAFTPADLLLKRWLQTCIAGRPEGLHYADWKAEGLHYVDWKVKACITTIRKRRSAMPPTFLGLRPTQWMPIVAATAFSVGIAQRRAAAAAQSALPRYTFAVHIEGKSFGAFRQVSGLSVETDVIEFKDGGGSSSFLPGNTKYSNIKLSRGFTGDTALWEWYTSSTQGGHVARVNGLVSVMNRGGQEIARFNFMRGWPRKYDGPSLNAGGNDVAIESIEIAHEGLTLTGVR
jgi:phage tail-like protein